MDMSEQLAEARREIAKLKSLLSMSNRNNQQLLQAQVELKASLRMANQIIHDQVVANQAAWIEWRHGNGAEAGMNWIQNGLLGPGHIPDEDAPWSKDAQAWFDANKCEPFPACHCGRPSNILWMGKGACSNEHMAELQQPNQQGGTV